MLNARAEFEKLVASIGPVKAAEISLGRCERYTTNPGSHVVVQLPVGFTPKKLESILVLLDREYDDGYGRQYLFGTIWFQDGTWATRREYDGSEWWEHHALPELPAELR